MPENTRPKIIDRLRWAGLGLGLRVLAFSLMRTARKDAWLDRAIKELDGVFRFRSGDRIFSRHLVFRDGRVFVKKDWDGDADFTFTIYDFSGLALNTKTENILDVIIGNKVGQSGNMYYLFQFGFVTSLLERAVKYPALRKKTFAAVNSDE
jgi:hypothetical protein